jgi:hypothetical protein
MSTPLVYVKIQGQTPHTSSLYPTFQNIPNLAVPANAANGDDFLVTLTAPDTWNDTAGGGGWFAITCNSSIVARGLFTGAVAGQRVPISLQAVVHAPTTGTYHFAAQFCCQTHGVLTVGAWSETVLSVLRV